MEIESYENYEIEIHLRHLHYFRVYQCPLFVFKKCPHHKPHTCFHWHYENQRRRNPYSSKTLYDPNSYCNRYNEAIGCCSHGSNCKNAYNVFENTEVNFHPIYFKTNYCSFDGKGICTVKGKFCPDAHGMGDFRAINNPQTDVTAQKPTTNPLDNQQVLSETNENSVSDFDYYKNNDKINNNDILEKAYKYLWFDQSYIVAFYKTVACYKINENCRQGYSCNMYHSFNDRRRSVLHYKYESKVCPLVKKNEEWLNPLVCPLKDNCNQCHTRTEQQFHPEIYKSIACADYQISGTCPRGPYCAFFHKTNIERSLSSSSPLNKVPNIRKNTIVRIGSLKGEKLMMYGLESGKTSLNSLETSSSHTSTHSIPSKDPSPVFFQNDFNRFVSYQKPSPLTQSSFRPFKTGNLKSPDHQFKNINSSDIGKPNQPFTNIYNEFIEVLPSTKNFFIKSSLDQNHDRSISNTVNTQFDYLMNILTNQLNFTHPFVENLSIKDIIHLKYHIDRFSNIINTTVYDKRFECKLSMICQRCERTYDLCCVNHMSMCHNCSMDMVNCNYSS